MMLYSPVIIVLMLIIFNVNTAIASDWKYITADEHGRYYYNVSSFAKSKHNLYVVSVKEEYIMNVNDVIYEAVLLEEIDCYSYNYRNKDMTRYYTDKTSITVNFEDPEWSDAAYGTIQFDIIAQICHDAKLLKPYIRNKMR